MSLLDHFKAPIVNVGSLVTILMIALLFGVFRLSDGSVSLESARSPAATQFNEDALRSAPRRAPVAQPLDLGGRERSVDRGLPTRPGNNRDPQGLDDIESALGLR